MSRGSSNNLQSWNGLIGVSESDLLSCLRSKGLSNLSHSVSLSLLLLLLLLLSASLWSLKLVSGAEVQSGKEGILKQSSMVLLTWIDNLNVFNMKVGETNPNGATAMWVAINEDTVYRCWCYSEPSLLSMKIETHIFKSNRGCLFVTMRVREAMC